MLMQEFQLHKCVFFKFKKVLLSGAFIGIGNSFLSCACFNVFIDTLKCLQHQLVHLQWTQLAPIKETHMPCRLASAYGRAVRV